MSSTRVRIAVVIIVAAALMIAIGRLERAHEHRQMLAGIARVRAAIGPSLTRPGPTDYLQEPPLSCLLYDAGGRSYALELCIDPAGRVVEASDRRGRTLQVYSIESEPNVASLRIAPALVSRLIVKLQTPASPPGRAHTHR